MKNGNMGIRASDANGLISEQSAIIISETTKNPMNLATPPTLMNRHTNNTMKTNNKHQRTAGVTSRMMVAFILLVAGFGASVAQAQLSAFGAGHPENCSPQ
jgi:hypothetical protein